MSAKELILYVLLFALALFMFDSAQAMETKTCCSVSNGCIVVQKFDYCPYPYILR